MGGATGGCGEWTVGHGHVVGGWDVGTSPLPDEVHQLLGGDRPLLHAVVQNLKALVLLTLQRMEVETEKGDAKTKTKTSRLSSNRGIDMRTQPAEVYPPACKDWFRPELISLLHFPTHKDWIMGLKLA